MIDVLAAAEVAATVPPTPWWETALTNLPGQVLVALIAFGGVVLTLRHSRKLQDRKSDADSRDKRVDTDNDAIAKLIVTMQPWLSAFANWGSAYARAGAMALASSNVNEQHDKYAAASLELNEALAIARITVRNPAARPALDSLREQRAKVTGLVSLGMLGQPDPEFAKYWREIHEACAKAVGDLEEAAVNWDGELGAPIEVAVEAAVDAPKPQVPEQPNPDGASDEEHSPR